MEIFINPRVNKILLLITQAMKRLDNLPGFYTANYTADNGIKVYNFKWSVESTSKKEAAKELAECISTIEFSSKIKRINFVSWKAIDS